jgi:hypothetical protein
MNEVNTLDQEHQEMRASAEGLRGTFRYSTVKFYVDMRRPDAHVIPIGVMAEISLPTVNALGLIARTELSAEEMRLVSELAKPLVSKPFEYLAKQCDEAWNTLAPGTVLNHIAEKHAYSALHLSAPEGSPMQLPLTATLKASVMMQLGLILDGQMQNLLDHPNKPVHVAQPLPGPQEEMVKLKTKAAAA